MLIIAGHLRVDPAHRDRYVAECIPVVEAARAAVGCLDFSITADSLDSGRVVVYERWEGEGPMLEFRGSGPSDEQQDDVRDADVRRYVIASVGDA